MWKKATPSVILFLLLLGLLLSGCSEKPLSNAELWQAAMTDAVFSEDEEVVELVTLTEDDPDVIWDEAGERVLPVSYTHLFPVQVFPEQGYPRLDLPELDFPVQVVPVQVPAAGAAPGWCIQ